MGLFSTIYIFHCCIKHIQNKIKKQRKNFSDFRLFKANISKKCRLHKVSDLKENFLKTKFYHDIAWKKDENF
jgi:hypothetical protein